METAPNTTLLPWPLWLFLLLAFAAQTASPAPTPSVPPLPLFNSTLLFAGPGSDLRNCSCAVAVSDCDEAMANTLCRCRSVPRPSLPPTGLRAAGHLTVWAKEAWLLELLNGTAVRHLQLVVCGPRPVGVGVLALRDVQTIRITAPEAPFASREVTVWPLAGLSAEAAAGSAHWTLLDVAVFGRLSALKAFTVLGPPPAAVPLPFPRTPPPQNLLVTFVY